MNQAIEINTPVKSKQKLHELQTMLLYYSLLLRESDKALIIVFEGLDASGKSGCIKRIVNKLDPKYYSICPISKPDEREYSHHYLWRFWTKIPEYGNIAIFDRSWYGRVLVERIEDLCTQNDWQRAYDEINEFERVLTDDKYIIVKIWLDVSDEEQLERFKKRMEDPEKRHKITDEDWRNRSKRNEYISARDEMLEKTNTPYAPWNIIASDNKKNARIECLEKIISYMVSKS